MRKVIVTDAAEAEIGLINEYLSVYSIDTANAFLGAVEARIDMLEQGVVEFPVARDPVLANAGYRYTFVKSYLMLYTVAKNGDVHIAHVFHQSQDYAALVGEIQ